MIRKRSSAAILLFAALILPGLGHLAAQTPAAAPADNPLQLTADHAAISAADIDKEEAFYVEVLGFQEFQRGGTGDDFQWRHLRIRGVFRIDLTSRKGSARHISPDRGNDMEQGWDHIAFNTPDLDKTYQLLAAKGATVQVSRDENNAINNLMVIDPEGNKIQIQH